MSKVKTQDETGDKADAPQTADERQAAPRKDDGPARATRAPAAQSYAAPAQRAAASRAMQRSLGNARALRLMSDAHEGARAARAEDERKLSPAGGPKAARVQRLAVSHPEDASEKEAESVARSVVEGRNSPPITPLSRGDVQTLAHRQEKEQEPAQGEDKEKKAVGEATPAARLAQRRAQEDEKPPQRMEDEKKPQLKEDEKKAQLKEDEKRAQPKEDEKKAPGIEDEKPPVAAMRLEATPGERTDAGAAEDAIERKGAGSPVSPAMRRALEPRMGADLSAARVHQDSAANEAASAINARAFAHGNDIYLARGESENDTHLMAHELTHVVQQTSPGASGAAQPSPPVSRKESDVLRPAPAKETRKAGAKPLEVAPGVLELKGMTAFEPPSPIKEFLEQHKGKEEVVVRTRFGGIAEGELKVKKGKDNLLEVKAQPLPLVHPLFTSAGEAEGGLRPSLVVRVTKNQLMGHVGLAAEAKLSGTKIEDYIEKAPGLIGMAGINIPKLKLDNRIDAGHLHLSVENATIGLGPFSGGFTLKVTDEKVDLLEGQAKVVVQGLAEGEIKLARNKEGLFTGQGSVKLALKKGNFTGGVDVAWDGSAITGEGKVGYQSEKMSGEVTLRLMEKGEATRLHKEKKAPPAEGDKGPAAEKSTQAPPKPKNMSYVVFGEGDLTFAFNEWLNGTAHVIVDQEGFVTIIGKITPQKEFELFEQKDFIKPLFKFEARAAYGIPVVGNVFIFANVGMDAFAKLGPAKFYNIVVEGTYSTNPEENKDFSISGSINISAAAGLRLTAQAGVGLEILDHDIKAGAGLSGIAGIKAYAEATPTIGYREKGAPGEDKKGEFFIRGDLEIAAQPFLGLSGELFVEIDTPWWSPLSDKRWTWPLFDKEYPIGGSFGLLASVDYVFGSKQWPAIEFKPVDFSADKFMSDLYDDKVKSKSAEEGDKKGEWKEKNTKDAEVPAGGGDGNAQKGTLGAQGDPKPTVESGGGGGKGGKKGVDDNATTADGKKVADLKKKATEEGKQDTKGGTGEKDPAKKDHDDALKKGLAALEAVNARFGKAGATKEEINDAAADVKKHHKVFKSIEVKDAGQIWKFKYVASDGEMDGPKEKEEGGGTSHKALLGKQVVRRSDEGDTLIEGAKAEGYIIQIRSKKANIRPKSSESGLPDLYIDAEGKLTDVAPEGTKKRDLDQIAKDYGVMAEGLKVTVAEPKWSSPKTEKELEKYRHNLREAVAAKYADKSLADLDTEVLKSKVIPDTYVKIRGEIFEEWIAAHNKLVKRNPRPWFVSDEQNLLQKDTGRSADGRIEGTTTLVEVKSLEKKRGPNSSEFAQLQDYGKIIKNGIKWKRSATEELVFEKVRYYFNRADVYDNWVQDFDENIGRNKYEIVIPTSAEAGPQELPPEEVKPPDVKPPEATGPEK